MEDELGTIIKENIVAEEAQQTTPAKADVSPVVTPEEIPTQTPDTPPVVAESTIPEGTAPIQPNPLKYINEEFGQNFETPESAKAFFEKASKLPEYEEQINTFKEKDVYVNQLEEYLQTIQDSNDVVKVFGGEDNYVRFNQVRQMGENGISTQVAAKILDGFDKAKPLDILVLKNLTLNPDLNPLDVQRSVLRKAGVDLDDPDFSIDKLTSDQNTDIALAAVEAKQYLNSLVPEVKLPQKSSFKETFENSIKKKKEEFESMSASWGDLSKRTVLNDLKVMDKNEKGEDVEMFSYSIGDKFETAKYAKDFALKNGLEPTEENLVKASEYAKSRFILANWENMIKEAYKTASTSKEEELDDKTNNNKPLNTNEAPAGGPADPIATINENILKIL